MSTSNICECISHKLSLDSMRSNNYSLVDYY